MRLLPRSWSAGDRARLRSSGQRGPGKGALIAPRAEISPRDAGNLGASVNAATCDRLTQGRDTGSRGHGHRFADQNMRQRKNLTATSAGGLMRSRFNLVGNGCRIESIVVALTGMLKIPGILLCCALSLPAHAQERPRLIPPGWTQAVADAETRTRKFVSPDGQASLTARQVSRRPDRSRAAASTASPTATTSRSPTTGARRPGSPCRATGTGRSSIARSIWRAAARAGISSSSNIRAR